MRIRTSLCAAGLLLLPAIALAQTDGAPPASPPAATSPDTSPGAAPQHRGEWRQRHAEARQKYAQLSAADKARFDDLTKEIRRLRHEQRQILGMTNKS
jgi:Spy/CpxP family protein refolding chaperone